VERSQDLNVIADFPSWGLKGKRQPRLLVEGEKIGRLGRRGKGNLKNRGHVEL